MQNSAQIEAGQKTRDVALGIEAGERFGIVGGKRYSTVCDNAPASAARPVLYRVLNLITL